MNKTTWLIYDGRYHLDQESAIVLSVAHSLKEARRDMQGLPKDSVIVETTMKQDGTVVNEKVVK